MKRKKSKPEPEAKPAVWIPVFDIHSLAAITTREEIIAIVEASKAKIAAASKRPPRLIPVFTAEKAAQIRRVEAPPPDAPV